MASRAFRPIGRFLIAYDGGPAALKAVDFAAHRAPVKGLDCYLVTVGPQGGNVSLDQPAGILRRGGLEVTTEVLHGEPEQAIAADASAAGIDLLVMGAYGHSRVRTLLIGQRRDLQGVAGRHRAHGASCPRAAVMVDA
jgi:nucleotide-binding universal stress UspA family protein